MKCKWLLLLLVLFSTPLYAKSYDNHRPSAWCGWQMRQWFGGDPSLNLAANWAKVGHSASAQVGAIVVWSHHVGYITGYDNRKHEWIVKSGNDGHAIRERARSISGAIAIRMLTNENKIASFGHIAY